MNKLNWGCGSIQPGDWTNVDVDLGFNTTFITTESMEKDYFDIIVAHCAIQMLEWHELVTELKELYRILKPGGVIRISLPDIERGFRALKNGEKEWFPNGEENINERFCAWLTWYSTTKTLLTPVALYNKLSEAGFKSPVLTQFKLTASSMPEIIELDTRADECFFMEATK